MVSNSHAMLYLVTGVKHNGMREMGLIIIKAKGIIEEQKRNSNSSILYSCMQRNNGKRVP
jgi:hypothetical protein